MNDWAILDLVLYFIGSLIALTQSVVFAHYYRLFRGDHLSLWSLSFLSLAIYLAAAGLSVLLLPNYPAAHPIRLFLSCTSLAAAYIQVAALIMGTMAIWRTQRWTRKQLTIALACASAFGILTCLAYAFDPSASAERLFLRIGLRHFIAGFAALCMGIAIAWRWPRARVGAQLTAIALSLYGLDLLHTFAIYLVQISGKEPWSWLKYLSVMGLISQIFIGYGLVIWLLENERDRAEHASNAAEWLRNFDPLTGLPNRAQMLARLSQQIRQPTGAALLLLRLDNLGSIAVASGMDGVDVAIRTSVERMEDIARGNGLVAARPGAEHIALCGSGPGSEAGLQRVAEQILRALARPMFWNGRELPLEASIGIALAPRDADTAETLQSRAEMARASAQREGPMLYRVYAGDLDLEAKQRLELQSELRTAFANDEFHLEFQPILDGWNLEICGFEALIRWHHPKRGRLLPEIFIAELEPLGLVEMLDTWVLNQACLAAKAWQREDCDPISVAVNVSAYSFQRRKFADSIHALLERTGLSPGCLEIEIIESIAMEQPERAGYSIDRLRDLGVRVMLDDFGTGFSSLKHLRQLPFDGLKIDQSFLVDVLVDSRDAAIVKAMLALAHSLGLEVVAEGIESAAQLAWFQSAGCDRLQGFHFHRPMEQEAVIELLRNSASTRSSKKNVPAS